MTPAHRVCSCGGVHDWQVSNAHDMYPQTARALARWRTLGPWQLRHECPVCPAGMTAAGVVFMRSQGYLAMPAYPAPHTGYAGTWHPTLRAALRHLRANCPLGYAHA